VMDSASVSALSFDPMDVSKTKDWDFLAEVRSREPICPLNSSMLFTARHADTAEGFLDAKRFSSVGDMRAPGVIVDDDERFLGEIDAPLHPKIRQLMRPAFTPAKAREAEPWTRASVRRRLRKLDAAGGGDLMQAVAIPMPGSVAAHVLGIPDEQHDQMMTWCDELLHSTWPALGRTERGIGIDGAFPELAGALDALIVERQQDGGAANDLLAVMVRATDADGWRMDPAQVRTLAVNILAGSLSASYMIGSLMHRYLKHPEDFAEVLRAGRSLIPAAVEESLRHEAPVMHLFRTATADTTLGGCPVPAGTHLMLGIGAANRDPDVFSEPDEFQLDREGKSKHLAFGFGPHLCIGNHLTRMVGAVVLDEMLELWGPGEVALAPLFEWQCVAHPLEYGPESLEVTVRH
jgi:cytochrome P450